MGFVYDYQYQILHGILSSGTVVINSSSGIVSPIISGVSIFVSGLSVNSGVTTMGGLGSGYSSAVFSSGDIVLPNKAIGVSISGVTSVFCSSLYTLPSTTYLAYVAHNASGMNFFISGKTISGFSVGFNVTGASASTIDWMIFR